MAQKRRRRRPWGGHRRSPSLEGQGEEYKSGLVFLDLVIYTSRRIATVLKEKGPPLLPQFAEQRGAKGPQSLFPFS